MVQGSVEEPIDQSPPPTLLQDWTAFSESIIWDLQRAYFEERGTEAWRQGEVPHYVTTNPRQANAYAEMIMALRRDHRRLHPKSSSPIHILELGSGTGKMAYYMLRRLEQLCEDEGISLNEFRYVLSDFTQRNVEFWKVHPRFSNYIDMQVLDIARFDVTQPGPLHLQISDTEWGPGQLDSPVVVIANYLWDSIPQELVYVANGETQAVHVMVNVVGEPALMGPAMLLEKAELDYALAPKAPTWMSSPLLKPLLAQYAVSVPQGWTLFPASAIRCLSWLRALSPQGLMLLTADKGAHDLQGAVHPYPPTFANHGSISLNVNYHAMSKYCEGQGGISFFPEHPYFSVNTGCLLLLEQTQNYAATLRATHKFLDESGPDTYFTVYKCIRTHLDTIQFRDIAAALRLSLFDSHQLNIYIPRIAALLPNLTPQESSDLLRILNRCWENYFPLAEGIDLATGIGSICYALDAYEWALYYFSQSTDIYGAYTGTFFNMAVCHHMQGDTENAVPLLQQVVAHDPDNAQAVELLRGYGVFSNTEIVTV
ncbi:MAG: hypothetical protein U0176_13745 [Bacteroidia bacterium]